MEVVKCTLERPDLDYLDDTQKLAVDSTMDENEKNVVIQAPAGSGKALTYDSLVVTTHGYKKIGELTLEDEVFGEDGFPHKILGIFPQGKQQVYKVIFSDDNVIKCSPNHYWTYQTKNMRDSHSKNWRTNTIEEIYNGVQLQRNNGAWNVYLPQCEPIQFEEKDLPIDPYLLGVLLGDGALTTNGIVFTCAEQDLLEKVKNILLKYNCELHYKGQYDYRIKGEKGFGYHGVQDRISFAIDKLGLRDTDSHSKFIPTSYLFSSETQRLALLQGIIDTDGYCGGSFYDLTLASKQLILDTMWLCESLGFTCTYSEKQSSCNGKDCGTVYRLYIKTSKKYPKIHTTLNKDSRWKKGQSQARRTIREIIQTDEYVDMVCIAIDNPSHLYLTEHCIPTHNTTVLTLSVASYRYEYIDDRICAITFTRRQKPRWTNV